MSDDCGHSHPEAHYRRTDDGDVVEVLVCPECERETSETHTGGREYHD